MKKKSKKSFKGAAGQLAVIGIAAFAGGAAGYFGIAELSAMNLTTVEMILALAALIISLYLSMFLHVLIHEGGHLVMGLATGYGFLSYRAGSHIWVKKGDKIVHGRFQMPGTGGQCLLSPPKNRTGKENPAFLYNLGGGLFNLAGAALAAAAAFCLRADSLPEAAVKIFFICFALIGIYLGLLNLIPLKVGGVPNDGYNMRHLVTDENANGYFDKALAMYEAQCRDIRLSELPEEMFAEAGCRSPEDAEAICAGGNALEIGFLQSYGEKLFDGKDFAGAEKVLTAILKGPKVPEIYRTQAAMLQILICMITGKLYEAEALLERKTVKKYLSASPLMPTTACIKYGFYTLLKPEAAKAEDWKKRFDKIEKTYPFKADYRAYGEIFDMITQAATHENAAEAGKENPDEKAGN